MIFDSLAHIENYRGIAPRIYQALEILRDTDFSQLADGTYEVDGFDLRYNLMTYELNHGFEKFEAHRDFIDIQFMVEGSEIMGFNQLDQVEEFEAHPEGDIWFYHGEMDAVTVEGDKFALFFPNDAHAPGIMPPSGPCKVRKCVFKIHI